MTDGSVRPFIAGLAIGIAFFLILTYIITILSDRIITMPAIGLDQVLATIEMNVERDLPEMLSPYKIQDGERLDSFGLLEVSDPEFKPVQLVFVHKNGTHFLVNQTDYSVISSCDLTASDLCFTGDRTAQDAITGHLIYIVEASWKINETIGGSGRYMVDALNGRILYPLG